MIYYFSKLREVFIIKKLILGSSAILLSSIVLSPLAQASELEVDNNQQILENTSTFSGTLPLENLILPEPVIAPNAYDIGGGSDHYLYSTKNDVITIKQQNQTAAANALLLTASGLYLGSLGYVALSTLTTVVGSVSAVETLFTGDSGAQFNINVKTYVYKSGSPTSTYWGYGIIVFSNAKTGKSLTTKKIIIGKTG